MTERHDSYRGIAGHYDLHIMDWYGRTYGPRLLALLSERRLDGCEVIDAGCGTGTLALALARKGYRVTGVDLSGALLDVARGKDAGGAVRWRQGDITRFDLGETVDLVVTVADVLNHLETIDDWEAALRRFAAHLRPGGALFLDVLTCHGLKEQDTFSVQEKRGVTLMVDVVWEPAARRSTMKMTSFRPAEGTGLYERATETITEWGQSVAEIFERLARAGFDQIERLWAMSEDPEAEERLALLARRA